jgi:hypothetical protein
MFDQVPGTDDLINHHETGYKGLLFTAEHFNNCGLGYHFTGINWQFCNRANSNINVIENYLFFRNNHHLIDFEARYGYLQLRPEPLGQSKLGFNIYLGLSIYGFKGGFLYESLQDEPTYTGVLVMFTPNIVNRTLGSVHFDYTRAPEGFVMQLPFWQGYWGIEKETPKNAIAVGEVKAERTITYWQNGQGRNFYEHIISTTGITSNQDLIIVAKEEPWYLKIESLVSPHNKFQTQADLNTWERGRQGPAQLAQKVTYKFYKKTKHSHPK